MCPSSRLPSNILAKEFVRKCRNLARSSSQLLENRLRAIWISVDGPEFFSFPESRGTPEFWPTEIRGCQERGNERGAHPTDASARPCFQSTICLQHRVNILTNPVAVRPRFLPNKEHSLNVKKPHEAAVVDIYLPVVVWSNVRAGL